MMYVTASDQVPKIRGFETGGVIFAVMTRELKDKFQPYECFAFVSVLAKKVGISTCEDSALLYRFLGDLDYFIGHFWSHKEFDHSLMLRLKESLVKKYPVNNPYPYEVDAAQYVRTIIYCKFYLRETADEILRENKDLIIDLIRMLKPIHDLREKEDDHLGFIDKWIEANCYPEKKVDPEQVSLLSKKDD